jgi:hypothetical protein
MIEWYHLYYGRSYKNLQEKSVLFMKMPCSYLCKVVLSCQLLVSQNRCNRKVVSHRYYDDNTSSDVGCEGARVRRVNSGLDFCPELDNGPRYFRNFTNDKPLTLHSMLM